jgi:pyruvate dehydrogenase E1 component alpha subunit
MLDLRYQQELLRRMKRIRHVEEQIAARYHESKMRCPTHLSVGQEAVAAAVGFALRPDDFAVSSHRAHAHYLGKGGSLEAMLAEIYGKQTGCCLGRGGSMHLIDLDVGFAGSSAIVASSIPVGVGLALSVQLLGTDQLSCVFLGDGAVEEGAFYESVNFAALRKLPVLFVCENNLYSVYSPMQVRQPPGRKIHEMVRAIGISAGDGDGNDVEAVYRQAVDAVGSIRRGQGPRFLELYTYRWREHCGPNYDNDIGYRSEAEFLCWKAKDPISRYETYLTQTRRLSPAGIEAMQKEIEVEVNAAFEFADASPFPAAGEAYTRLFR